MLKIYYKSKRDSKWRLSSWADTLLDARMIVKINSKNGYESLVYNSSDKTWHTATWDGEQVILADAKEQNVE